jgi:hypothetical protein
MRTRATGFSVPHPAPTRQRPNLIEQEGLWRRERPVNQRPLNSRLVRVDLGIAWALADGRATPVGTGTCACRGSVWRCGDHGCDSRRCKHRCDDARVDGHRESPLSLFPPTPDRLRLPTWVRPHREDPVGLQPVQRGRVGAGSKNFEELSSIPQRVPHRSRTAEPRCMTAAVIAHSTSSGANCALRQRSDRQRLVGSRHSDVDGADLRRRDARRRRQSRRLVTGWAP